MPARNGHAAEVQTYLQTSFGGPTWTLSLPHGSGQETYLAAGAGRRLFVKLGADPARADALAAAGLTPPVAAAGLLEDGTPILVQPWIEARTPGPRDFQVHLDAVAALVRALHHDPGLRAVLPRPPTDSFAGAGLRALAAVRARWEAHRARVPGVAAFVDASLNELAGRLTALPGGGLVAAHGDICNANWLLTTAGRLYLVDLEALALDDPAADLGPLLWWYYPPALRPRFLAAAGYAADSDLAARMAVRTALHCLAITLPRPGSFDRFDPASYPAALADFRAALAGAANPQGYGA